MADTILVVEDEPFIRLDIAAYLEECGFRVLEAATGASAVAMIGQHPEISLVFTDVRMPGKMDGVDLARWIMANHPQVAVMVASGDIGKETALRDLGGARTVLKPYRPEEVSAAVHDTLRSRRPD